MLHTRIYLKLTQFPSLLGQCDLYERRIRGFWVQSRGWVCIPLIISRSSGLGGGGGQRCPTKHSRHDCSWPMQVSERGEERGEKKVVCVRVWVQQMIGIYREERGIERVCACVCNR